jgi:hypothetical protein
MLKHILLKFLCHICWNTFRLLHVLNKISFLARVLHSSRQLWLSLHRNFRHKNSKGWNWRFRGTVTSVFWLATELFLLPASDCCPAWLTPRSWRREAICSLWTSVYLHWTAPYYIPEGLIPYNHHCENLRSYINTINKFTKLTAQKINIIYNIAPIGSTLNVYLYIRYVA